MQGEYQMAGGRVWTGGGTASHSISQRWPAFARGEREALRACERASVPQQRQGSMAAWQRVSCAATDAGVGRAAPHQRGAVEARNVGLIQLVLCRGGSAGYSRKGPSSGNGRGKPTRRGHGVAVQRAGVRPPGVAPSLERPRPARTRVHAQHPRLSREGEHQICVVGVHVGPGQRVQGRGDSGGGPSSKATTTLKGRAHARHACPKHEPLPRAPPSRSAPPRSSLAQGPHALDARQLHQSLLHHSNAVPHHAQRAVGARPGARDNLHSG